MNRLLISKAIKAALNIKQELRPGLEKMCDLIISEEIDNDDKSMCFNTIVECISPGLEKHEIDLLLL